METLKCFQLSLISLRLTNIILSNKIDTFLLHWQWPHDLYPLSLFPIIQSHSFVSQNTFSNAGGVSAMLEMIKLSLSYLSFHVQLLIMKLFGMKYKTVMATICAVIYRHPNDNLDGFLQYLNSTTEHIDQGSKYCNICADLGNFNVDLLKIEKHQPAKEYFHNCIQPSFFTFSTT